MTLSTRYGLLSTLALLFMACTSTETVTYDLPSAGTKERPTWVETHREVRDTIFVVIRLPDEDEGNMEESVQKAQSELHALLMNELEVIIRDYWEQKGLSYSEDQKFDLLSGLPVTLEQVMKHVTVTDGWMKNGEVRILCAMDYEEVAEVIMDRMDMNDRTFQSYLKRRMDELSEDHR